MDTAYFYLKLIRKIYVAISDPSSACVRACVRVCVCFFFAVKCILYILYANMLTILDTKLT